MVVLSSILRLRPQTTRPEAAGRAVAPAVSLSYVQNASASSGTPREVCQSAFSNGWLGLRPTGSRQQVKVRVRDGLATIRPEPVSSEPVVIPTLDKLCGDGITRSRTEDGIYWAFWTDSGLVFIDPLNDVKRGEDAMGFCRWT